MTCLAKAEIDAAVTAVAGGAKLRHIGLFLVDTDMQSRALAIIARAVAIIDRLSPTGCDVLIPLLRDAPASVQVTAAGALGNRIGIWRCRFCVIGNSIRGARSAIPPCGFCSATGRSMPASRISATTTFTALRMLNLGAFSDADARFAARRMFAQDMMRR